MGREWLEKLEALPEQNWYSLLQQGVIRYALAAYGDGSVDESEESVGAVAGRLRKPVGTAESGYAV